MIENHMVLPAFTSDPLDPTTPDADPESPEEKAERERIEARDQAVAEFVDELDRVANWYEAHPETQFPEWRREMQKTLRGKENR